MLMRLIRGGGGGGDRTIYRIIFIAHPRLPPSSGRPPLPFSSSLSSSLLFTLHHSPRLPSPPPFYSLSSIRPRPSSFFVHLVFLLLLPFIHSPPFALLPSSFTSSSLSSLLLTLLHSPSPFLLHHSPRLPSLPPFYSLSSIRPRPSSFFVHLVFSLFLPFIHSPPFALALLPSSLFFPSMFPFPLFLNSSLLPGFLSLASFLPSYSFSLPHLSTSVHPHFLLFLPFLYLIFFHLLASNFFPLSLYSLILRLFYDLSLSILISFPPLPLQFFTEPIPALRHSDPSRCATTLHRLTTPATETERQTTPTNARRGRWNRGGFRGMANSVVECHPRASLSLSLDFASRVTPPATPPSPRPPKPGQSRLIPLNHTLPCTPTAPSLAPSLPAMEGEKC
ncbi:hypothetical protein C7M84_003553 [Penaeus vannamei]|uniref:Uncharacterized protein n=1 Tax=Penaeus vannamei TaxID=6689 RepID=A0A423TMT7_PENVA|nr:hypothetical protein C7M84_003553 [Penaeus vannamei]